jgi:hypothetical protein
MRYGRAPSRPRNAGSVRSPRPRSSSGPGLVPDRRNESSEGLIALSPSIGYAGLARSDHAIPRGDTRWKPGML